MRVVDQLPSIRDTQRTRHPEVHEQRPTRFEPHNQILATATDLRHAFPDERVGDDGRVERPHEAWIADLHPLETARPRGPA